MTIDSRYRVATLANDGGLLYPFEIENAGETTMELYKVAGDGTRTLLSFNYHYIVTMEEHSSPLFRRGIIELVAPLSSDAHLMIYRNTPIETLFDAVALNPFPTEQLEYTVDKICLIQQELEGHKCDCRGAIYEGTPAVPDPI